MEKKYKSVLLQAIIVSTVFLLYRIFHWTIREKLTVFLYPIFFGVLIIVVFVSILISLIYAIIGYVKRYDNRTKRVIPILIETVIIGSSIIIFSQTNLRRINFLMYDKERRAVAEAFESNEIQCDKYGELLVEDSVSDKLCADGSAIRIIDGGNMIGIYFCTFTGVLESSEGYLYVIDKELGDVQIYNCKIVVQEDYGDGVYFIGTD